VNGAPVNGFPSGLTICGSTGTLWYCEFGNWIVLGTTCSTAFCSNGVDLNGLSLNPINAG